MYSIFVGCLLISLLHAVIPNHWLPVLAIGRKEGWSLAETSRITFIAGMAHVISTIIIGVLLAMIGSELTTHIEDFTKIIGPSILILIGLYFVRQHYTHHHFHLEKSKLKRRAKVPLSAHWSLLCFCLPAWRSKYIFCLQVVKAGISLLRLLAYIQL